MVTEHLMCQLVQSLPYDRVYQIFLSGSIPHMWNVCCIHSMCDIMVQGQ